MLKWSIFAKQIFTVFGFNEYLLVNEHLLVSQNNFDFVCTSIRTQNIKEILKLHKLEVKTSCQQKLKTLYVLTIIIFKNFF